VYVYKSKTKIGYNTALSVKIYQHARDIELLENIAIYLGCGRVASATRGDSWFVVSNFSEIVTKILPFFDEYNIKGIKAMDYSDFNLVAEIMKKKEHLTEEGLDAIRKIKDEMNSGRLIDSELEGTD